MTVEPPSKTLLSHALTWLAGLFLLGEAGLLIALPAATRNPPTGPFASLEGPGRASVAVAAALAAAYAHGRLVSRHTSRPFILLLSLMLACLGAMVALAMGEFLDPYLQASHVVACIAGPILIAISLEAHGIECFERRDLAPYNHGQDPSLWTSEEEDNSTGLPNPLVLGVAGPFAVACLLHLVATHGIGSGNPPATP